MDQLTRMTILQLEKIKKTNYILFQVLMILNLSVFYYALYKEHWIVLFLSLGFFVSGIALYDNYKYTVKVLKDRQNP